MSLARRTVLGVVAGALSAGCSALNGGDPGTEATTTEPVDQPACDPADVTRLPVASGTNIEGRNYPQKPEPLSDQSILEYLGDFETAFAWNRVLQSAANVTSLNVDNLDGVTSDETGDGYLASGGIRVSYSPEDGEPTDREYVANYFVSPLASVPVRVEHRADDSGAGVPGNAARSVRCGHLTGTFPEPGPWDTRISAFAETPLCVEGSQRC